MAISQEEIGFYTIVCDSIIDIRSEHIVGEPTTRWDVSFGKLFHGNMPFTLHLTYLNPFQFNITLLA